MPSSANSMGPRTILSDIIEIRTYIIHVGTLRFGRTKTTYLNLVYRELVFADSSSLNLHDHETTKCSQFYVYSCVFPCNVL